MITLLNIYSTYEYNVDYKLIYQVPSTYLHKDVLKSKIWPYFEESSPSIDFFKPSFIFLHNAFISSSVIHTLSDRRPSTLPWITSLPDIATILS